MNGRYILILLACLLCLGSCQAAPKEPTQPAQTAASDSSSSQTPAEQTKSLRLDGRRYTYSGAAEDIAAKEDRLTILTGGTYRLSGTLRDGCLHIDAPYQTVHLILDGACLTSSHTAPLQVENAACVIVETAAGTVNRLTDSAVPFEQKRIPTACLEANCQLVFRGSGSLIVSGRRQNALSCSQSVAIESGSLTLSAPDTGLWVRDALLLSDGTLTVTAAKQGVLAAKDETAGGLVTVSGGRLAVAATELAMFAGQEIRISGGVGDLSAPKRYEAPSLVISSPDFPKK